MRKTILLIEDDIFLQDLYVWVLKKRGYEVLIAPDGERGLELAKRNPDIILLDIMLSVLDGISVLKKLKEIEATKMIPVVLLTNLGQKSIVKKAMELGALGYLLKIRLTPYQLADKVEYFLTHPDYIMDFSKIDVD